MNKFPNLDFIRTKISNKRGNIALILIRSLLTCLDPLVRTRRGNFVKSPDCLFTDLPGTKSGGEKLNDAKSGWKKKIVWCVFKRGQTTMTNGKGNERRCPVNKGKQEERLPGRLFEDQSASKNSRALLEKALSLSLILLSFFTICRHYKLAPLCNSTIRSLPLCPTVQIQIRHQFSYRYSKRIRNCISISDYSEKKLTIFKLYQLLKMR